MKVLLINGSPHRDGNTSIALAEVARTLESEGIETKTVWIGTKPVQGCIACYKCYQLGRCVFHDDIYEELHAAVAECDGLIVGSPTYYAGPAGSSIVSSTRRLRCSEANPPLPSSSAVAAARVPTSTVSTNISRL